MSRTRTQTTVCLRAAAALLAIAVVLAGCSGGGGGEAEASPSATGPASSFTEQLYYAQQDETVSDAQLAALKKAAQTGDMSYEELNALLDDSIACLEAAGIYYARSPDWEPSPGFKIPNISYGEPLAVSDACMNKTSNYASAAYQAQPRAVALLDAALTAERPQVIACLRAHGFAVDDDATLDEIRTANLAYMQDQMNRGEAGLTEEEKAQGHSGCSKYL